MSAATMPTTATPVDTAVVLRARSGDAAALDALVAAHLPLVYGVVGRGLGADGQGDAGDVDDVVQETMVRAVASLPRLQDPERFRSWLVSIAYRQMQEHRRARRRRPVPQDPHDDALDDLPDPADVADRAVADVVLADQRRSLTRAARWLDPAHQGVLGLWWQETCGQLGRGDLSRALGVDRRHAAVRVQRMRGQLDAARGVVLALDAAPRCPGLERAASGWDGAPSPLWRKRLHRHVRGCESCLGRQAGLVPPERLVPAVGLLPVPAALAATVSGTVRGGAGVPAADALTAAPSSLAGWWHALVEQVRYGGEALVAKPAAAVTAASLAVAGGGAAVTTWVAPQWPSAVVSAMDGSSAPEDATPDVEPADADPAAAAEPPPPSSPTRGVATADLYVSPDGSDSGDGSYGHPFASLARALEQVRPGETIALRGGLYQPAEPLRIATDGTADARIVLSGYRDETPVLDLSGLPSGDWPIVQTADHWTVQSLEITGSRSHGFVCESCADGVFRHLSSHGNARSGLLLRGDGTTGNTVRDSEFFDNHDDAARGHAGIGLGITFGSGEGNVVEGNRFERNADDGVDLAGFTSPVTLRDNVASGNGVERWDVPGWEGNGGGFTLGGGSTPSAVPHVLTGNVASGNGHHGFADGGNTGGLLLTGNTARDNGEAGFWLPDAAALLRDNVSVGNGAPLRLGPAVVVESGAGIA